MNDQERIKFSSIVEFWDYLPEDERVIVDVLRQIILTHLPETVREKLVYNVPFYCGNKHICMIWPASVPRGGIRSGVLLGFSQGFRLNDPDCYLAHGTNKRVYYKIFHSPDEIDEPVIARLLREAAGLDSKIESHAGKRKKRL